DVNRPVWTGCWWGTAEIPLNESGVPSLFTNKTLRTETGLTISLDDLSQKITITNSLGANLLTMQAGQTNLTSQVVISIDAPQILHGGQSALPHPGVLGDHLLTYLNQIVLMFNTHTHIGELAVGVLPVTPVPPFPQMPPATPTLLSTKNFIG